MLIENVAFAHLVDNELCEILTDSGWHEGRWCATRQCFFFAQDHDERACPMKQLLNGFRAP